MNGEKPLKNFEQMESRKVHLGQNTEKAKETERRRGKLI